MPVTDDVLRAEHLRFSYGVERVLDDVSFDIHAGDYVGIVGPNGGGKTTLLKIMVGLLRPHSGSLSVFGQPPVAARRGGSIGYIPQRIVQADFSFPATVEEVVRTGAISRLGFGRRLGVSQKADIDRAFEETGTTSLRRRLISELSGGQRQRVFIARALAARPSLLILDEPTTGVDAPSRDAFYQLLKTLNKDDGITILFVSHDMDVMTNQVNSVLCLNQKLVCHTSAHSFAKMGSLEDLYGSGASLLHHHHH